ASAEKGLTLGEATLMSFLVYAGASQLLALQLWPSTWTGPALAAGLAAVEDQEHVDKARRHNDKWLKRLDAELKNIGITALPSVGNFVLLRFAEDGGRDSKAADAFLTGRGILARNVDNYHLPDCLRVTIGKDAEMDALLAALTEFMA
ncbi:MAG: aminotransferase class I/II-fold pyridoxal phosphate-dependent enzyme, partial [Alphaproteobacteria bacterium]|nr:aminotransferase class I/II-fold pyridoxal phosphate-dependent enzyme [Alphaproteobacteria bacterium]